MKGSDFILNSVQIMYYQYDRVNCTRGGSYIYPPEWIKKKKTTMNPKKEDDKCFQCAATVALYFKKTESHREIVSNIILFINKYNLEGINYPSKIDDCKTFEKSNPTNCS